MAYFIGLAIFQFLFSFWLLAIISMETNNFRNVSSYSKKGLRWTVFFLLSSPLAGIVIPVGIVSGAVYLVVKAIKAAI